MRTGPPAAIDLSTLHARPAGLASAARRIASISLGPDIDAALPAGGLARGALHEVAGTGADTEHAAAAALFVAAALAGAGGGMVLWITGADVFAPALAGVGLHPDRVIHANARRPEVVLRTMEDALRHAGLAGVVGEFSGTLSLTASRRLQLAAEASGTAGFLVRRSRSFNDPALGQPNAATTRWRIGCLPSAPPIPWAPDVAGLARARWRLDLIRSRGGAAASWVREAPDATGCLGILADLADRSMATPRHHATA